jgi:hypothetical protein
MLHKVGVGFRKNLKMTTTCCVGCVLKGKPAQNREPFGQAEISILVTIPGLEDLQITIPASDHVLKS